MNLFRSEEHVRNMDGFDASTEDGIISLPDLMKLFSGNYFTKRMDSDWVSHSREYAREMGATMIEIGKTGPFWLPEKK